MASKIEQTKYGDYHSHTYQKLFWSVVLLFVLVKDLANW